MQIQNLISSNENYVPVIILKFLPSNILGNALLWTDKYQPSSSIEVIGNSGSVKKLKNWLSEWKHILDREAKKARKLLMKKNKGKLQKTEGIKIWTYF